MKFQLEYRTIFWWESKWFGYYDNTFQHNISPLNRNTLDTIYKDINIAVMFLEL